MASLLLASRRLALSSLKYQNVRPINVMMRHFSSDKQIDLGISANTTNISSNDKSVNTNINVDNNNNQLVAPAGVKVLPGERLLHVGSGSGKSSAIIKYFVATTTTLFTGISLMAEHLFPIEQALQTGMFFLKKN